MAETILEGKYIGPALADLFDSRPAERAARRMADKGGDSLHDYTVRNTPIKTGNLRSSWYRDRTEHQLHGTSMAYVSRVATDVGYAPYVNYGTGLYGPKHMKYLIEPHPPRQFLSWLDPATGERRFAKQVWHPGSEGQFMVEFAAAKVEATINETLAPELEVFRHEMEALALKAQAGVVLP